MAIATTINMTSTQPNGKPVTKALTFANPAASDAQIAQFIVGLAGLSNNTLVNIEKVSKTDLAIPTGN